MIISFNEFLFENFTSGPFITYINNEELILKLYVEYFETGTEVYLFKDTEIYDNLSILLPNSHELRKGEFFLNPDINPNIVKELIEQNFITKKDIKSIAGDKETISYKLNIS